MNKKTVIFDMGGVLVDLDIEDCKKVFREELGYEGIDEIIAQIGPTVDILEHIRPLYNFKASE